MLRVELSFLAVFAFLWLAGHFLATKNVDPVARKTSPAPRRARRPDESLTPSAVEPEKLQDPQWVVAQVSVLCRSQVQRALELYRVAVRAGLNIKDMSKIVILCLGTSSCGFEKPPQTLQPLACFVFWGNGEVSCQDMPANECQQLYANLVTAVIRVGQADDALSLIKERKC